MTLEELNNIKNNYKVLEIAVDFINPSYNISRVKRLDNARYLVCTLTENGIPRNVKTNEVARIRLQKPDRTYVYNDCDIIEDGRVFITFTEQILAVEGNAVCDIQLTDEETGIIYSTKNFIVNIDKTAVDNSEIASSDEFDALNNLISTNKKLNDELNANEEIRKANENERIKNENLRINNENTRENNELSRQDAEAIRVENENERIVNENTRKSNEIIRQNQETDRQTNTATAIANANVAAQNANDKANDLQNKLDSHHFVLTEDKDVAGGVPSLDNNGQIPSNEVPIVSDLIVSADELNYVDGVTGNIQTQLNAKAPLASPTLTGTPKAPTALAGTNSTQIATTAFVQNAVSNGIAASDALIFKGSLGTNGTITALPTTYKTGWTYRVITAGIYAGQVCEIGDLVVSLVDRNGTDNLDSDWCVTQTNINGAITGIKSGDAYIQTSQTGSVVTITHKDVTRSDTTSTILPSYGGTFIAVKSVTTDSKGHIIGIDTETVTLPAHIILGNSDPGVVGGLWLA